MSSIRQTAAITVGALAATAVVVTAFLSSLRLTATGALDRATATAAELRGEANVACRIPPEAS